MMRLSIAILTIALLAGASAEARPKVGVTCSGALLNTRGALACAQKGKEDAAKGITNIHFVACLSDGTTFCCVKAADSGYDCSNIVPMSRGGGNSRSDSLGGGLLQVQPH